MCCCVRRVGFASTSASRGVSEKDVRRNLYLERERVCEFQRTNVNLGGVLSCVLALVILK